MTEYLMLKEENIGLRKELFDCKEILDRIKIPVRNYITIEKAVHDNPINLTKCIKLRLEYDMREDICDEN